MKRFRGGLVFKAHRLLHHSTLGSRVTKKKRREVAAVSSRQGGRSRANRTVKSQSVKKFATGGRERETTQWSTILSSKVNLPDANNFRALGGANVVTLRSKCRPNETRVLHREERERPLILEKASDQKSIGPGILHRWPIQNLKNGNT